MDGVSVLGAGVFGGVGATGGRLWFRGASWAWMEDNALIINIGNLVRPRNFIFSSTIRSFVDGKSPRI
jgi:hypothetical protein